MGLLTTIEFLPFILFTLPAGVWVDRLPRKPILVVGDLVRAAMLVSIPIAWFADVLTIWQLYVVGFVNGVMTVFFDVADQSYLPTVVERDQLVDGNAKLQMSHSSAQILGQPVGGGIVALFSAPVALFVDAISFVGSALLIVRIRSKEAPPARASAAAAATSADEVADWPPAGAAVAAEAAVADPPATSAAKTPVQRRPSMRQEIAEGLRYILGHRFLANIAGTTALANFFANIAFAIFAVYVYRTLELTPAQVGLIGGLGGGGVLLGALLASRVAERIGVGPTIVGSAAISGFLGLLVPAAPKDLAVPFLAAAFFGGSIMNVIYNVNQVSLRQAITPERFLGRMNATMRFIVWGTIPVGSVIGAGLSEVIGVHTTVWVGAILGLFAFLPALLSPVRTLRRIPDLEPDGA